MKAVQGDSGHAQLRWLLMYILISLMMTADSTLRGLVGFLRWQQGERTGYTKRA